MSAITAITRCADLSIRAMGPRLHPGTQVLLTRSDRVDRFDGVNTLGDPKVAAALDRMFAESADQFASMRSGGIDFSQLDSASAQERADALRDYYLPVTRDAGRLLYALVRATRPATVVEFGMSLGISAIHLASAIRDNGSGRVVTTELSAAKVSAAKETFVDIGLDDLIEVLEGDALSTLKDLDGPVDFVLLDGWKELYSPVLELLEPRLTPGSLVVADNTSMVELAPYLQYVRDPANGYVSVSFPARDADSMEISCRV
jgi:predicted O-methyltransferase YrrM